MLVAQTSGDMRRSLQNGKRAVALQSSLILAGGDVFKYFCDDFANPEIAATGGV
jgi:hypothetical protein